MTILDVAFLIVALVGLIAACVLYAGMIASEPAPTEAEKREWPGWGDEYHE